MTEVIFPDIFINDKFEYTKNVKDMALADGLVGWANCMTGTKPPKNFGKGMMKIGNILGIIAQPENLMKYAKENK